MAERQKPRLRFSERIEELHEHDAEDSGQFGDIFRMLFLPGLIVAGVAVLVSVLTWFKESLSGRAPLIAGGVIIVLIASLTLWRWSRRR